MEELVSIIVPVYNVENYISRCIKSLIMQSFTNIQIILVNDGSCDDSGKICEQYAKQDERIIVIHSKNLGVSSARNIGMEYSKGEYLMFVDADDFISKNCVEDMINCAKNNRNDILICLHKDIFDGLDGEFVDIENEVGYCQIQTKTFDFFSKYTHSTVWGVLYKREIIQNLKFDINIFIAEDSLFFVQALLNASTIGVIKKSLYFYNNRNNSASAIKEYDYKKSTELLAWEKICQLVDKEYNNTVFSISSHAAWGMNAYKGLKCLKLSKKHECLLWNNCVNIMRSQSQYVYNSNIKKHIKYMYRGVCIFPKIGIALYKFLKRYPNFQIFSHLIS